MDFQEWEKNKKKKNKDIYYYDDYTSSDFDSIYYCNYNN